MGGGAAWARLIVQLLLDSVAPCRAQLAAVPSAWGRQVPRTCRRGGNPATDETIRALWRGRRDAGAFAEGAAGCGADCVGEAASDFGEIDRMPRDRFDGGVEHIEPRAGLGRAL